MRILVPVDSSEFAFKALEKAMQMAKQLGAQLTIMSVPLSSKGMAEEVPISYAASSRTRRKRASIGATTRGTGRPHLSKPWWRSALHRQTIS